MRYEDVLFIIRENNQKYIRHEIFIECVHSGNM